MTIADAVSLRRGLEALETPARADIVTRARTLADRMVHAEPRLAATPYLDEWDDRAIDRLAELFSNEACPALGPDGSCRVYPFRPVACRTMGTPVESDGVVAGACDVQTFVPIAKLSAALRAQEQDLSAEEAGIVHALRQTGRMAGEDLFLPFGFLPDRPSARW
jgi:Fe-S-cluster containining protein